MKQKQRNNVKWNNIPKDKDGFFNECSDLYDRLPIIVAEVTNEDVCLHYIDAENWHDTLADLSRSRFKYYIQVEPLTTEK